MNQETKILKLALNKKILTPQQIKICMQAMQNSQGNFSLAQFLLQQKFLTREQIQALFNTTRTNTSSTFQDFKIPKNLGTATDIQVPSFAPSQCPTVPDIPIPSKSSPSQTPTIEQHNVADVLAEKQRDINVLDIPKGSFIGKYEIVERVGKGGMGVVYKAKEYQPDRVVAIKLLQGEHFKKDHRIKRFLREMQLTADLNHPNIIEIYNAGNHQGVAYLAMEFVEGVTLREYCKKQRLSLEQQMLLLAKIAKAIHYAHNKGIVHRDIKPSNILISKGGKIHVMDFGLAKSTKLNDNLTKTGEILGTLTHMAPEQIKGAENIDKRTDIYALGVILFEMITGKPMIEKEGQMQMMYKISNLSMNHLRLTFPEVPEKLEWIWWNAVNPNKNKRYGTAKLFAGALEQYTKNKNLKTIDKAALWTMRYRAILAVIIVLLLATLALFSIITQNRTNQNEKQGPSLNVSEIEENIEKAKTAEEHLKNARAQIALGLYENVKFQLQQGEDKAEKEQNQGLLKLLWEEKVLLYSAMQNYQQVVLEYELTIDTRKKWQQKELSEEVLLALAKAWYYLEKPETSQKFLKNIKNTTPESLYYDALTTTSERETFRKFREINDILAKKPESNFSHRGMPSFYMGKIYLEREDYQSAVKHFLEALQDISHLPEIHLYLGKAYFSGKNEELVEPEDAQKAKQQFLKYIQQVPNDHNGYYWLAKSCFALKEYRESSQYTMKALKIYPWQADFVVLQWKNVAKDLWNENRYNSLLSSIFEFRRIPPADILLERFVAIERNYERKYQQIRKLQKQEDEGTINTLLTEIEINKTENRYYSALQGLMVLRHTPQLRKELAKRINYLEKYAEKIEKGDLQTLQQKQKEFLQIINSLKNIKQRKAKQEKDLKVYYQKYLDQKVILLSLQALDEFRSLQERVRTENIECIYYLVAKFYSEKNDLLREELSTPENLQLLKDVLKDDSHSEELRYLAGKALLELGEIDFLEERFFSKEQKDLIESAICACVLSEAGFYKYTTILTDVLKQNNLSDFMHIIIGKNLQPQQYASFGQVIRHSDSTARVSTASHFLNIHKNLLSLKELQSENYKIVKKMSESILFEAMKNKNASIRSYAHYNFWLHFLPGLQFPDSLSPLSKEYLPYLLEGLNDPDQQVRLITLQFALRLGIPSLIQKLEEIVTSSQDTTERLLAILVVAKENPGNDVLRSLLGNQKEDFIIRFFALVGPILGMLLENQTALVQRFPEIRKMLQNVADYRSDPDINLRLAAYWLSGRLGNSSLNYLDKEDDRIKAILLVDSSVPSFPMVEHIFPKNTQQDQEITKKYLQHNNEEVRKAAYVSYMATCSKAEKQQMYQKLLVSQDKIAREGAALGLYHSLFFHIQRTQIGSVLKIFSIDQYQHFYSESLEKIRYLNIEKAQLFLLYLDWMIKLHPMPKFHYSRAVLHKSMNNHMKALEDLGSDNENFILEKVDTHLQLAKMGHESSKKYLIENEQEISKAIKNLESYHQRIEALLIDLAPYFSQSKKFLKKIAISSEEKNFGYLALFYWNENSHSQAARYIKYTLRWIKAHKKDYIPEKLRAFLPGVSDKEWHEIIKD